MKDDVHLLRLIYEAEYITGSQVLGLLPSTASIPEKSFLWRINCLIKRQLIDTFNLPLLQQRSTPIYSLTNAGRALLQSAGDVIIRKADQQSDLLEKMIARVNHALAVNEARTLIHKMPEFMRWESGPEIEANNMLNGSELKKDYDAVVTVADPAMRTNTRRFGLEMELSPKTRSIYREIGQVLGDERKIQAVVYLVPHRALQMLLMDGFKQVRTTICICRTHDFFRDGLTAPCIVPGPRPRASQVLTEVFNAPVSVDPPSNVRRPA